MYGDGATVVGTGGPAAGDSTVPTAGAVAAGATTVPTAGPGATTVPTAGPAAWTAPAVTTTAGAFAGVYASKIPGDFIALPFRRLTHGSSVIPSVANVAAWRAQSSCIAVHHLFRTVPGLSTGDPATACRATIFLRFGRRPRKVARAVAGVLGVRKRWRRCLPSREHVGPENARGEVADEAAGPPFGGLIVSRVLLPHLRLIRCRASQGG